MLRDNLTRKLAGFIGRTIAKGQTTAKQIGKNIRSGKDKFDNWLIDNTKGRYWEDIREAMFGNAEGSTAGLERKRIKEAQQFQTQERESAEDFSADQADINREWQENMSNTAVRRQMNDLTAAGINPILAAGQLGGASFGNVSTPMSSSAGAPGGQTKEADPLKGVINSLIMLTAISMQGQNNASRLALETAKFNAKNKPTWADEYYDREMAEIMKKWNK